LPRKKLSVKESENNLINKEFELKEIEIEK
jgi:hypothetical protein